MIKKKTIPWEILFFILAVLEVSAYYFSGLFTLQSVSMANYQEKFLTEILLHPLRNYWNDTTIGIMGVALILWLMAVSYFITYYKNYHFGKEQGTADWGDLESLSKKLADKDESRNTYVSRNIKIGFDALSNMNMLLIGASGTYKSTSFVERNLTAAYVTNIVVDIKGELLRKHGKYLRKKGVAVKALNFKNPEESDRYNPFRYIDRDSDLMELITIIQKATEKPDQMKGDPFWDDGVALYLSAMFYYEWLEAKEQGRRATMNNILKLVNWEAKKIDKEGTSKLQRAMDDLAELKGDNYPPVRDYRKLKDGAPETVRSIVIMVNAQLRLFELPEIQRIFEDDDIDIPSLGLGVDGNPNKKTALFIVLKSRDSTYDLFINIFYAQLYRVLCDLADDKCKNGRLPIHVRLIADEFYTGPKPQDTEKLLGEIRGRNLSIIPVLQDLAQAKTLFPNDKWETFVGNCAALLYFGSGPGAYTTHQMISEMLSKATIDSRSEHISSVLNAHGQNNLQTSTVGVSLMTVDQVREMPPEECIVFLEARKPLYDRKGLPWEIKDKEWLESQEICGDGYRHPVRVVYNEGLRKYRTIQSDSKIQFLEKRDLDFYQEAQKTDPSIKVFNIDETDFLYLNWNSVPQPTEKDMEDMFRQYRAELAYQEEGSASMEGGLPEDAAVVSSQEWNLTGSIADCLLRYADKLTEGEQEEIIGGLEDGLSEAQIKRYFALQNAKKMNQYRRAYLLANGR